MGVPIHVTSKDKAPKVEHFAIFKFSSITRTLYTENDDTISVVSYEAYLDKGAWLAEIEHLEKDRGYGREPYYACIIKPVEPKVKVSVEM